MVTNIRLPVKVAYAEEFEGDAERRTAAYSNVREDSSTATYKLPAEVEFCRKSIDSNSKAEYIIKSFEGLRLQPYYCPAGLKTIGWGHVIKEHEQQQMSDGISQEHADYLLEQDIEQAKYAIYRHCRVPLNYSQQGALISFIFNCGAGAFQASSLRQKLLRGEYLSAADEFPKWVYARGIKLKGLVRRRLLERAVFLQN